MILRLAGGDVTRDDLVVGLPRTFNVYPDRSEPFATLPPRSGCSISRHSGLDWKQVRSRTIGRNVVVEREECRRSQHGISIVFPKPSARSSRACVLAWPWRSGAGGQPRPGGGGPGGPLPRPAGRAGHVVRRAGAGRAGARDTGVGRAAGPGEALRGRAGRGRRQRQAARRRFGRRSTNGTSASRRLRHEQAQAMFDLARRAVRAGRASLALDLVLAAVRENPDHEAIRRMLGLPAVPGPLAHAYEVRNLRAGKVWNDRFGWLRPADVARYEKGQRYHARPLDLRRGRRPAAPRHPPRLGRRDRALHDPHRPQHRGGRRVGREARTALPRLEAALLPLLRQRGPVGRRCSDDRRRGPRPSTCPGTPWSISATATSTTDRSGRWIRTSASRSAIYVDATRRAYFFAGDG